MDGLIKLSKAAKQLGITKTTLYNWRRQGRISFVRTGNGMNFLTADEFNKLMCLPVIDNNKVVIYCRVSSSMNKDNLRSQKMRLVQYANARGYNVIKIIEEIGSGLNDGRPKLLSILGNNDYKRLIVEHKDRLCRHGFNYIETLFKQMGKEIEVVNVADTDREDLVQDFISIITSYCARIYGQRRNKRRTEELIRELKEDVKRA